MACACLSACAKKKRATAPGTRPARAAPAAAAHPEGDGEVEDLTIVVEADKSRILQEESALQARREDFEREKARLQHQRDEISEKLASISKKDRTQRDKLESAEERLADEQRRMRDRASTFEAERSKLDADKNRLLERIAKMTQGPNSTGLTIEQREDAVARRERDVAARERDVARREADAGHGLQDINRTLEALRSAVARSPAQAAGSGDAAGNGPTLGRAALARLHNGIHARMAARGILDDDLPPTLQALDTAGQDTRDLGAAQAALTQLGTAVDAITVNHAFVQAKMARINGAFEATRRGSGLDDAQQKKVEGLLADASDAFSDGRYDRANKKINQIAQLLQRP